jgi:site-specific recombinase XerD
MIERIFSFPSVLRRQLDAPLLQERNQYLTFLLNQGVNTRRLRRIATMLLHIIRLMEFDCMRSVELDDIKRSSQLWFRDTSCHKTHKAGPTSAENFYYTALGWLRFHDSIIISPKASGYLETISADFSRFMEVRGMCKESVRVYSTRLEDFLRWAIPRCQNVSAISLRDVDEYLRVRQLEGCKPRTIATFCTTIRLFFGYAEMRGLTDCKIGRGIRNPRFPRYDPVHKGLPWKQVRELLNSDVPVRPADLRASAILFLCSIYGLRAAEIARLTLEDFDWVTELFLVRRAKRGRIQQFPLQFEVGDAILKYMQKCRPRCACRNLFVTLNPPYRPIRPATIFTIIACRIRRCGLNLRAGTHSFRHACATELLRQGSSLKEIADFLGHRDLESVSIYAKSDIRSLRKVAAFSLGGVK